MYTVKDRSEYLRKLEAFKVKPEVKEKKICRKHPTSFWGKRSDGTWFDKCARGFKEKEDCIELTSDSQAQVDAF